MDCTHNTNTQERNENIKPCNQFSNRKVQNDSVYNSSQPETVITNSDTNTENETESSMIDGDLDPRIQVSIHFEFLVELMTLRIIVSSIFSYEFVKF